MGVAVLKDLATGMDTVSCFDQSDQICRLHFPSHILNQELEKQNQMLDDVNIKVDDQLEHLDNINVRMKTAIEKVMKGDHFMINFILLCTLLCLVAFVVTIFL
jgi:SYP7 family syntaxin